MPTNNVTITIPAGESLSDAAAIANAIELYLITPPDWTPANLTFQFSVDGTNFYDLFTGVARAVGVGNTGAGAEVLFGMKGREAAINPLDADIPKGASGASLKLRSGTRYAPVPQEEDRVFTLIVVT